MLGAGKVGVKIVPKPSSKPTPAPSNTTISSVKKGKKQKKDTEEQATTTEPDKGFVIGPHGFVQEIPPSLTLKEYALEQQQTVAEQNFNIRINCYVINNIISGLFLFFVISFNLSHFPTIWRYSMSWMFIAFYTVCLLDIIGSFCGILSLVPEYTFGGWILCNWLVNVWNKFQGKDTFRKRTSITVQEPTKKVEPPPVTKGPKKEIPTPKKAKGKANKTPPTPKPSKNVPKTKAETLKAGSGDGQGQQHMNKKEKAMAQVRAKGEALRKEKNEKMNHMKKGEPAAKPIPTQAKVPRAVVAEMAARKYRMEKNEMEKYRAEHPGWFCKGTFRKCTLCTTGIKVHTKKMNESMAAASLIILNVASVLNVFCTAFYKYMKKYGNAFNAEEESCIQTPPGQKPKDVCARFNIIFDFLLIFVYVLIFTRMFTMCVIGWHTDPSNLYELRKTVNRPPRISTPLPKVKSTTTSNKISTPQPPTSTKETKASSSSDAWSDDDSNLAFGKDDEDYERKLFRELYAKYQMQMGSSMDMTYDEAIKIRGKKAKGKDEPDKEGYDLNEALRQFYRENEETPTHNQVERLGSVMEHESQIKYEAKRSKKLTATSI